MGIKLVITMSLLSVFLLSGGYAPARNFDSSLKSIVRSNRFSMLKWEYRAIPHEIKQIKIVEKFKDLQDKANKLACCETR